MAAVRETIRRNNAYYCLDCGKCTSVCPVSALGQSPRLGVKKALESSDRDAARYEFFWSCLTCKACNEICPADVSYAEMTADMREFSRGFGISGECTHSAALNALERIMTAPDLKQNRMDWLSDDLRVRDKGDLLYFVGCIPYLDVFFGNMQLEPVVMRNERCCGHDLLWTGETKNFRKLVEHNVQLIKETGAKSIVTACAECYKTLKQDYPRFHSAFKYEVLHISELFSKKAGGMKLALGNGGGLATYHDACRLGRFAGVFEEPRSIINSIEGLKLKEMERSRKAALCCGSVAWTNCGSTNKEVQIDRLREAKRTGADFLVTTCPKCQIHFKCAMEGEDRGKDFAIEMVDLACLLDRAMK
jgi:heterodisulfide reductase subunit D